MTIPNEYGSLLSRNDKPCINSKTPPRYQHLAMEEGKDSSMHRPHDEDDDDEEDSIDSEVRRGFSQSSFLASMWGCRFILLAVLVIVVVLLALVGAHIVYEEESRRYHYIVVGGGPSGILTAWKLARSFPELNVLLLESGTVSQASVLRNLKKKEGSSTSTSSSWTAPTESDLWGANHLDKFDVPLLWSGIASDQGRRQVLGTETWSDHHWPIQRTLLGRALGGSGLHNAMIYVRALPTDFERWNMSEHWTYDKILPHYVALEHYVDDDTASSPFWRSNETLPPHRGSHGLVATVPAGVVGTVDAVAPLFVQSALHAGHRLATRGFNGDPLARLGVGYYEFNIEGGVRDSIAHALLGKQRPPSNLEIRTGVTVTRVLTDTPLSSRRDQRSQQQPRAVGVEYVQDDAVGTFWLHGNSHDEVILASGCILTPQLLMNSGIGQDGALVNLPGVGQNVQDHPVTAMAFQIRPELAEQASSIYTVADEMEDYLLSVVKLQDMLGNKSSSMEDTVETKLLRSRLGTFGTAGFSSGAFLQSPWADDAAPDLQLTVFPRVIEPHVTRQQKDGEEAFLRSSAMLVTIALLRPEARYQVRPSLSGERLVHGSITDVKHDDDSKMKVDRTSPLAKALNYRLPSIELPANRTEYLTHKDVKRIAWGMEQVRRILQSPPLSNETLGELYPGDHVTGDKLKGYIRTHNLPNSHWVGSTKMGHDDDPMAVVDGELRVRGVQGLRIVDSGVIPHVPNGNTHSTVCVMASRAADLIADARKQNKR